MALGSGGVTDPLFALLSCQLGGEDFFIAVWCCSFTPSASVVDGFVFFVYTMGGQMASSASVVNGFSRFTSVTRKPQNE
ncbi:MAG: hypothetical protein LBI62_05915 [Candidatus Accumulibacter sp.]|jgi:hypothetical protein|nr:hypothetical protein [Accumulibacter sp.]